MATGTQAPARGRPRTITRERIVEAGIRMGLPGLTFVGVAGLLGVSHMALYKHVSSLGELRQMVAAEIFERWDIPKVGNDEYADLEGYLMAFTASLRNLVRTYPGLAPYLIRRAVATPAMMAKIDAHHRDVGRAFGIPQADVRQILAMVAFHCIAVADTVYAAVDDPEDDPESNAEMEAEFELGMRTLIAGALLRLKDRMLSGCAAERSLDDGLTSAAR